MESPRRRLFGPLLYCTLALGVMAVLLRIGLEIQVRSAIASTRPRPVAEIVKSLDSADDVERRKALSDLLGEGEGTAIPVLLEQTMSPRGETRLWACQSLVLLKTDPALLLPALVDLADDPDVEVRVQAAIGLGRLPEFAGRMPLTGRPPLTALSPEGRELAISTLRTMTADREPPVRFASVRSLVQIGTASSPATGQALLTLFADPDLSETRQELMKLVKRYRPELIGELLNLLEPDLASDDPLTLHTAIDALAELGIAAQSLLPRLEAIAQTAGPNERAAAGFARVAIEGPGSPRCIPILVSLIADDTLPFDRRQAALDLLRATSPNDLPGVTPGLIQGLTNPNANVRNETLYLLQQITQDHPAELPSVFQNP